MLLGLFVLIAGALAKTPCVTQTINLNGPYSLPLTALADSQFCTYTFNVPAGQFAYTSVIGQDMMKSGGESVIINDISGYAQIMGASSNGDYRVFNSTLAWPQAFSVNFQSYVNTNMKVQISITLQKNLRGQNVVQTVTTSTDSSSAVLYTVDLKEGQTYNLNSLSSVVDVKTAYAYPETYQLLNNVFAYDNGILVGTLLSDSLKFKSRNVQLYVARPVYGMNHGAILVTDQSNIVNLKAHYVTYAPIDREDHSQTHLLNGDGTRAGAVTIISDKDGSSPITVTHLNELDDNTAEFTYVIGGPLNTRARDIKLTTTPVKMIGNMNTFYILKERATIQYSV